MAHDVQGVMNASKCDSAPFAILGLITALFYAAVWIVAAASDPTWVFGESMVSELGISDVQLTADLFKYGCIIAGLLIFVFGLGKAYTQKEANRTSGILIAIAGIFLILVGVYNMNYGNGNIHNTVACLFFAFMALAVIASMLGDWAEGRGISVAVSAIFIVVVIGTSVGNTLPYVEAIAIICALIWLVAQSVKMIVSLKE